MWILVWICACVLAWQGSTIAGGTRNAEVKNLALTVGYYNRLSTECMLHAMDLADASVRAQITEFRPTARLFKERENKEINRWQEAECPDRALVGIAYGASQIANVDLARRRINLR